MNIDTLFMNLDKIIKDEGQTDMAVLLHSVYYQNKSEPEILRCLIQKLCSVIDEISIILKADHRVLISVKNQKVLRTSLQLITSLGVSPCLIPGLGINLSKRCSSFGVVHSVTLNDNEKYDLLVECTKFYTRSYEINALKSIIITFHLSDYLAALIQLCFAPLKKPGTYSNYVMTPEMYEKLTTDRLFFTEVYENLVANCFQPTLMKELLVLQGVIDPMPPPFARRAISKELSRRLLAPRGVLSLIRCFIDSYEPDVGCEWKKTEMVCKIISAKHGTLTEAQYLDNICKQLTNVFQFNHMKYLPTSVSCVITLNEKYKKESAVEKMTQEIFQPFNLELMLQKYNLPGTIAYSVQEVETKLNILEACVDLVKAEWPVEEISQNMYILFQLASKCNIKKLQEKADNVITKCLGKLPNNLIVLKIKEILFGIKKEPSFVVEEYEGGPVIKCVSEVNEYDKNKASNYLLKLVKDSDETTFIKSVFESSLNLVMEYSKRRINKRNLNPAFLDDNAEILTETDHHYATILQILSEICSMPKIITVLKSDPSFILNFIEFFLISNNQNLHDQCISMALVLLNIIVSESNKEVQDRCRVLIPLLRNIAADDENLNSMLGKEALNILTSIKPKEESACEKAISDVFDNLLPVRAHGIIELTKLVNKKDADTLSKKHYVFCLLQEQLKDKDSYIYLSAINGISALGVHCTEEVLNVLCQEYLQMSSERNMLETADTENQISEIRMKIGDAIVKVTKGLGEMAVVHKSILLNTVLCACRDTDPLVRASALSNLAELARVLNYRMGTIIYEVLLCVWNIIESDKAVECRRAAVMVISSLLKGLGKDTIEQLKDNLLPIYRSLKKLYSNDDEDQVVRLHAQIALEELNDTVKLMLFPEVKREKQIFLLQE